MFPKTTPECKRLVKMVIDGLKANILDSKKREVARVALKRLRNKRCFKGLEYVMQVSCDGNPLDAFANEPSDTATRYLDDLS